MTLDVSPSSIRLQYLQLMNINKLLKYTTVVRAITKSSTFL